MYQTAYTLRVERERQWHQSAAHYLFEAGYQDQADKTQRCHDGEHIVAYRACSDHPEHHAKPIHYHCRLPICPTCSHTRANGLVRRLSETVLNHAEYGRPDFSLRHMVLTTPYELDDPMHPKDYAASWNALPKTLNTVLCTHLRKELDHDERRKGQIRWGDHQVGYIASADWGEDSGKLHFHVLYYGPFIEQTLLHDKWAHNTHGVAQNVWLRPVEGSEEAVDHAIAYVGKLSMVPEVFTPQLFTLLDGGRRIRTRGAFFAIKLPPRRSQHHCPQCGADLVTVGTPGIGSLNHQHDPDAVYASRQSLLS